MWKLNTPTLLSEKENETPDDVCCQFITLNYAALEDLMDTSLDNSDIEIFTDASSLVKDDKQKASYTIVIVKQVLEAKSPSRNECSTSRACGSVLSSRVKQRAASVSC